MSTRALYTVKDADTKAQPARGAYQPAIKARKGDAFNVYIHGDGYPTGAAAYVKGALKYAWELPRFEADEFAASLCASAKEGIKGGNARFMPQGDPRKVAAKNCADIQYRYFIAAHDSGILKGKVTVEAYEIDIDWQTGKVNERQLFTCLIGDFGRMAKAWEENQKATA